MEPSVAPPATDPGELLEVFDAEGRATGVAKERGAVHRDGDWHLAFFCWIFRCRDERLDERPDEPLDVVLQKRAATKDVWPGRFDASAAGHVRFGETPAEAAREIEEELGLHVPFSELTPVMRHLQEHVHETGLVDREIHDVHILYCDRPLEDYRPGPEVTGLISAPLADVVALARGARTSIATTLVTFDGAGPAKHTPIMLQRTDLVPYDAAYWEALSAAARTYSGRASIARR